MDKRGQFFILAAVILASIIVTLSTTVNFARTNNEDKFYSLSYDIKQEGAEVLDYSVVSGNSSSLEDFTKKMGDYVADASPDTELFFIYGNSSGITVENYAENAQIGDNPVLSNGCGEKISGPISIAIGGTQFSSNTETTARSYYSSCTTKYTPDSGNIEVKISNQTYNFSLGKDQRFLIVTKKSIGNDTYVSIK